MERIGIYGGTFNPPHLGHMEAACQAMKVLKLDRLLLIPDRIAPHKKMPADSASGQDRLAMLSLAAAKFPGIEVSDLELRRNGPSYTYETVEQLRTQYPQAELYLLMGTDMFLCFSAWKRWETLLKQTCLGVLYRGDPGEQQAVEQQRVALQKKGARIELVKNQAIPTSSTELRRLLVFRCAGELLSPGVLQYIEAHGLYGTGRDYRKLPMEALEQVVVSLLKESRVAHVLGCRDTAVELAKRWGADVADAARAGLLHDITKALDGPVQLLVCRAYGVELDEFSRENPKTLHALTGSLVAERIFGENPAVVAAIRSHTTGKPAMNPLEKIIYVADYMEPNRDFPGVERLRELAFSDLDGALRLGLEMTLDMLRRQRREISPASQEAVQYLYQQDDKSAACDRKEQELC